MSIYQAEYPVFGGASSLPFIPGGADRSSSMGKTYRQVSSVRGKSVSGFGNSLRRTNHEEVALDEARFWAEELQKAEFKGLGDTREAARFRVSQRTGIEESYLKRLRYKWREMGEVAGSKYRALMLAYEDLVQRNEAAAREYRAKRQELQKDRHAACLERAHQGVGEGGTRRREMAE